MENAQSVFALVAEAAALPETFDLNGETRIDDVPGWDSFAWVAIITGIEEYFGTEFPIDRVDDIRNVGDLIEIVESLKPFQKTVISR